MSILYIRILELENTLLKVWTLIWYNVFSEFLHIQILKYGCV